MLNVNNTYAETGVNLLNYHHHNDSRSFINSLFSLKLFPCNNKPTRITRHTSTLIDNISKNNIFHENKSCLLIDDNTMIYIYIQYI